MIVTTTPTTADPDHINTLLEYLRLSEIRSVLRDRARQAVEAGQTHLQFLASLLEDEVRSKRDRAARSRLAAAKMPAIKTLDGWDWSWNAKTIKREQVVALLELGILDDLCNLLLFGRQGLGKTRI